MTERLVRDEVFDILDEKYQLGDDIEGDRVNIAIDIADDFNITVKDVQRLISQWLILTFSR